MSSVLFVPIHLDALPLADDQTLVGPTADFTLLPFFDGERDVNPDIAYVSEDIVSRPFQNETLRLKAGVHLHWALPDALTRGVATDDGTKFPAVPNRWLVTRTDATGRAKQWVVESDYLYPEGEGYSSGSVSVPHHADPEKSESHPFRFLGRSMPLDDWIKDTVGQTSQYAVPLTAVGYGEPTFAAFYPNCHSVFGFHDAEIIGVPPVGVRYDVYGWYGAGAGDTDLDFLRSFVAGKRKDKKSPDAAELIALLEKEVGWTVAPDDIVNWYEEKSREKAGTHIPAGKEPPSAGDFIKEVLAKEKLALPDSAGVEFPSRTLCYASLTFGETSNQSALNTALEVAVGNTGTEALSAFLAQAIDDSHNSADVIEDQLEAMLLSARLEHRQLDVGFKFQEARHEKGFTAVNGGWLWTISKESTGAPAAANASDADAFRQVTLPDAIADRLNALNSLQQRYDQSRQRIQALRRQLFADWYKYMISAYPPEASRDHYPDVDEVKHFIETKDLTPLQEAVDAAGELLVQTGDSAVSSPPAADAAGGPAMQSMMVGAVTGASASGPADSLASELAKAVKNLLESLGNANREAVPAAVYRLRRTPGPRFWQPNDPVVLLSGAAAEATERHGQDGRLRDDGLLLCHVLPDTDLGSLLKSKFSATDGLLKRLRDAAGEGDGFAFSKWQHPWNPLRLEWEVEVFPVESGGNLRPGGADYAAEYITGNYALKEDDVDLSDKTGGRGLTKAANIYVGSSVMTPHAGEKVGRELEDFFIDALDPSALNRFYTSHNVEASNRNETYLEQNLPALFTWFLSNNAVLGQFFKDHGRAPGKSDNEIWLWNNLNEFVSWSLGRIDAKKSFYDSLHLPDDQRTEDFFSEHAGDFVAWLKPQIFDHDADAEHYLDRFYVEANVPKEQQNEEYLRQHVDQLITWYQLGIQSAMQMVVMIAAYKRLGGSNFLSQSLGGFNEALLMRRQTMQLPVADPLGFEEYGDFAKLVSKAVGNATTSAPEPLNDFNPVRSGAMRLNNLRLVDTFGQVLDVNCERVVATRLFETRESSYMVTLPPRLVQPARLNFRWLSAGHDHDEEMNDHPATTPVCGWVLPNNLDNSLMVYDNGGRALGSLSPLVGWETAPGEAVVTTDDMNPHLKKMVEYLAERVKEDLAATGGKDSVARGEGFLNDFISTLDSAVESIEPENFAQHQDLALFVGRPLALVRATLQWELQGGVPATNQSWESFGRDMKRDSREDDGFTRVIFPIRVGDYRQLNDGLVGYWKESGKDYEGYRKESGELVRGLFYAPQSNAVGDDHIMTHADVREGEEPVAVFLAPDSPPQTITLLLDPRGSVHATSGVVPTKAINIPPDQYADALRAIQVTFMSAPILTDAGSINLPMPDEPGYRWSWLEKDGEAWSEITTIGATSPDAKFAGGQEVREGWLKLTEIEATPDANKP